jgi:hypothetical protein
MENREQLLKRITHSLVNWKDAKRYPTFDERAQLAERNVERLPELIRKTTFYKNLAVKEKSSPHFTFVLSLVDLVEIMAQQNVQVLEHHMALTMFREKVDPFQVGDVYERPIVFSVHLQTLLMPGNSKAWVNTLRFYEDIFLPELRIDDCRRLIRRLTKKKTTSFFFDALHAATIQVVDDQEMDEQTMDDDAEMLMNYLQQRRIRDMKIEDVVGRFVQTCTCCKRRGLCLPRCSKCDQSGLKFYYCDTACQDSDWKEHKIMCRSR